MIKAVLIGIAGLSVIGVIVSAIAIDAITAARSGNLLDNSPRGYAHFNAFRLIGRLFHPPEPDLGPRQRGLLTAARVCLALHISSAIAWAIIGL